ncbi:MAG: dihydrodipicolinate synthase family protein [Candidatus Malihini olakiniferum]
MSHIRQVITEVKGRHSNFLVFCGFDEHALDTLLLGGDSVISAMCNFAPEITYGIYQAFLTKDIVAVQTLLRRLAVLSKIYTLEVPFTGLIKEAIRLTGLSISASAPATPPSPEMKQHLIALLRDANITIWE